MKIKSIELIDREGRTPFTVGHNGVTKIVDNGVDGEGVFCNIYDIYKDKGCVFRLESCPVLIEYFVEASGE